MRNSFQQFFEIHIEGLGLEIAKFKEKKDKRNNFVQLFPDTEISKNIA